MFDGLVYSEHYEMSVFTDLGEAKTWLDWIRTTLWIWRPIERPAWFMRPDLFLPVSVAALSCLSGFDR